MHNEQKEMLLSTLEDIKYSLELILKRANNINSSDDFLKDENGLQKLDSIAMRLSAIGEGFKNIDKLSTFDLRTLNRYYLHSKNKRCCSKCKIIFDGIKEN